MNRPAFLVLCLLLGLFLGAATVYQWARFSTPRPVTQLGGGFIHSLQGDKHA